MIGFGAELTDRLTRYCDIDIDSQPDADIPTSPLTAIQLDTRCLLVVEVMVAVAAGQVSSVELAMHEYLGHRDHPAC